MPIQLSLAASKSFKQAVLTLVAVTSVVPAFATTKGFNQIVTPDIQPEGVLSISFQEQHPQIGNKTQIQTELGVTRNFEVAVFQGFSPPTQILGAELGLLQHGPYLLSTGFVNATSHGGKAQPFLEGGYYAKKDKFVIGAIRVPGQTQALLGYAHTLNPKLALSADYQSGGGNSKTVGFTYNFTPNISLNPALYFTNDKPRHVYGYAVLTFNIQVFKGHNNGNPEPASQPGTSQPNQPPQPGH
ncbi:MAG: hypothetical protein JO316_18170 [Abitibacteriaceae bacterium]|nr:hypothetical protein [Abditibacteriaceae bacterium]MBV9867286.1 hypothetical protein [Abditibacteriaceae bacterium]